MQLTYARIVKIEIPQVGQKVELGEMLTIEKVKETEDDVKLMFEFADADEMYELVIVDYESLLKGSDKWLIGFKADIPGSELKEGFGSDFLISLFPSSRKKKQLNFEEEHVVFLLYKMDKAAYKESYQKI